MRMHGGKGNDGLSSVSGSARSLTYFSVAFVVPMSKLRHHILRERSKQALGAGYRTQGLLRSQRGGRCKLRHVVGQCCEMGQRRVFSNSFARRKRKFPNDLRPTPGGGIKFARRKGNFSRTSFVERVSEEGMAGRALRVVRSLLLFAPLWAPHVNASEGNTMAQQVLTARANLTASLFQGFVGAGRVVTLAHAMGWLTTYPVPTSPKPRDQKDPSGRPSAHEPRFTAMNISRLRAGRSAAC